MRYLKNIYSAARFWAQSFNYIIPDMEVDNIASIDINELKKRGIRGIIFDFDNTLTHTFGKSIDDAVKQNFESMTKEFAACILSNCTNGRKRDLEDYFGISVVQSYLKKPCQEPFIEALELLGTVASETAMIGDRLLTDVAGANMAGMYSIKVRALHPFSEPLNLLAVRLVEQAALRYKKICLSPRL